MKTYYDFSMYSKNVVYHSFYINFSNLDILKAMEEFKIKVIDLNESKTKYSFRVWDNQFAISWKSKPNESELKWWNEEKRKDKEDDKLRHKKYIKSEAKKLKLIK